MSLPLTELLAVLRANNVLEYVTPELTLKLGPVLPEFPKESAKERERREKLEDDEVAFAHVGH